MFLPTFHNFIPFSTLFPSFPPFSSPFFSHHGGRGGMGEGNVHLSLPPEYVPDDCYVKELQRKITSNAPLWKAEAPAEFNSILFIFRTKEMKHIYHYLKIKQFLKNTTGNRALFILLNIDKFTILVRKIYMWAVSLEFCLSSF